MLDKMITVGLSDQCTNALVAVEIQHAFSRPVKEPSENRWRELWPALNYSQPVTATSWETKEIPFFAAPA